MLAPLFPARHLNHDVDSSACFSKVFLEAFLVYKSKGGSKKAERELECEYRRKRKGMEIAKDVD